MARGIEIPDKSLEVDAFDRAVDRAQAPVKGFAADVEHMEPVALANRRQFLPLHGSGRRRRELVRRLDRLQTTGAAGQQQTEQSGPKKAKTESRHIDYSITGIGI